MSTPVAYHFGGVRFEPANLRLVHAGGEIQLTGKAARTLAALVVRPDVVVTKDELLDQVWPGTAVEENNLTQQVSALRRVLALAGADGRIETVPRFGYRFRGPVALHDEAGGPGLSSAVTSTAGDGRTRQVEAPPVTPAPPGMARRWIRYAIALGLLVGLAAVLQGWGVLGPGRSAESLTALARGEDLFARGDARAAVDELQRAVALDSGNARAYSVLAHALNRVSYRAAIPAPGGRSPSVEAAERAVEIDPVCGACQGTLGFFVFAHAWDWPRGERHLREAIRLEPDQESIRPSYALLLATSGRLDEALVQIDRALARRPYDVGWRIIRASILYLSQRYQAAVAAADQALLIDDTNRAAWEWRSKALLQLGRVPEAVRALSHGALSARADALEQAVKADDMDGALRSFVAVTDGPLARTEHSWRRGAWLAQLGEVEAAIDELERAADARLFNVIYVGVDPVYAPLRRHPRFTELLAQVGLDAALALSNADGATAR